MENPERKSPAFDPLGPKSPEAMKAVDEFFAKQARIENVKLRAAQKIQAPGRDRLLGGNVARLIRSNAQEIEAYEQTWGREENEDPASVTAVDDEKQ